MWLTVDRTRQQFRELGRRSPVSTGVGKSRSCRLRRRCAWPFRSSACLLRPQSFRAHRQADTARWPHQTLEGQLTSRAPGSSEWPGCLSQPRCGLRYGLLTVSAELKVHITHHWPTWSGRRSHQAALRAAAASGHASTPGRCEAPRAQISRLASREYLRRLSY